MIANNIPWPVWGLGLRDSLLLSSAVVLVSAFVFASWCVVSYLVSPLRKYPGPRLAAFTNLWRLYYIRQGSFHLVTEKLHKKYGPVVRIAPNVLDIDYPELVKVLFGVRGEWRKTESVLASSSLVNGKIHYNLFSETDPVIHAQWKRPISKYYAVTGVAPLEGHVDETIQALCDELEKRFMPTKDQWSGTIDFGNWVNFYTWDSVGNLTFSQPFGYLTSGTDFDGTLSTAERSIDYFATCYSLPFLDRLMDKNPIAIFRKLGPPGFGPLTGSTVSRMIARIKGDDKDIHSADQPDFLDKFLEAKKLHPDVVDDGVLIGYLMNNMIAGADTTGSVLRSAVYFCLKDGKRVWNKLCDHVRASGSVLNVGQGKPANYKASRGLQYLEAVVREALRFHTAVGLGLERYVPKGGFTLPGEHGGFVPEGVALAMNPYIICHNKQAYGEDADEFKPERWLKGDGETQQGYEERLQAMNSADLAFGGGSRSCIGKHVALMQLYKVMATLASLYDMELVDPEKEWKVINSLFMRQEGLEVRMKRRA